ncbi:MAG: UDP-N-acetylenolpyruvoylglucosamine reductase [Chloroflexi bacterium GWB2_49_20]|nr:MAG: UDP-N-acetylenolpyruvoylglucosamine reductase [Chloroflexi bacterium GWB2_49_20]OGN76134.1 MAG: UDP-N-acetylenolpyruvoylglucosamine reductase [Chloroflexi bacterium GWC2_49_37]OGN83520.1 MAG: UDP-N-acetylenolpyruvoylglucosamine reductase [Chloroflexi bacterium GWD2_49_16]HBG73923.1 UDP-N-acetylmuramate dehydrogenase [Anaerolineae bacterium]HCC79497.1 UDP-N-acetylmuramate dehydrogenase [Anaerolineae bacterium]
MMKPENITYLRELYGTGLQENIPLSAYTSARIGGPADAALIARSADELAEIAMRMWEQEIPFIIIGGGSNLLVSDKGLRELLIINRARGVHFNDNVESPHLQSESGNTMNDLAQKAALLGLGGLEWTATVPGSLGGAVYGNAGAFNGDMAGNLVSIDLVHRHFGRQTWPVEKMEYTYRSSILKRQHQPVVILSAELSVKRSSPEAVRQIMERNSARRRSTQPSGASMGSIFKNPPGDYAGRLIEGSGLKGKRVGNAEISPMHANFIVNHGQTSANDVKELIGLVRQEVSQKFGIELELEIELVGEW